MKEQGVKKFWSWHYKWRLFFTCWRNFHIKYEENSMCIFWSWTQIYRKKVRTITDIQHGLEKRHFNPKISCPRYHVHNINGCNAAGCTTILIAERWWATGQRHVGGLGGVTAKPRTENLTISLTSLYLAWLSTREMINWKEENEDSKKTLSMQGVT